MLRVLTLNLQHGAVGAGATQSTDPAHRALAGTDITHPDGARRVLDALATQLADLAPDVLALQEVDLHQARSGHLDQTTYLARALGMASHRFAATYAGPVAGLRRRPLRSALTTWRDDPLGAPRALAGLPPTGYGNALLVRGPVTSWHVARLGRGPHSMTRRGPAWDPSSYRLWTASTRLALAAVLPAPGPGAGTVGRGEGLARPGAPSRPAGGAQPALAVACAHLATRQDQARRQLATTWRALSTLPATPLLAGDLNLRTEHLAGFPPAADLAEDPTYPASAPTHRIDHLLAPGGHLPGWRVTGSGAASLVVSDHACTWVDLEPTA